MPQLTGAEKIKDSFGVINGKLERDGSLPLTGNWSVGGHKITDLAAPTGNNDAARFIDIFHVASLDVNGYLTFKVTNTLTAIIQWGRLTNVPPNTGVSLTFPITFPNGMLGIFGSTESDSVSAVSFYASTSWFAKHNDSTTRTVRWIAIGY